ncbi:MAG: 3-methylornithine--L-lysine ligase PylC [Methanomassiliicoccaceae archaeon]|nr:3-methylornithine--L-lysine ligase PylC [Methanomassiliicoccaceae archaeon]
MRLAIVGGALQGMEAAYLAKKAGYETIVIDKRNTAPAFSMSDESAILDPTVQESDAMRIFRGCDAVIPACEDTGLLSRLDELLRYSGIPFLFDMDSYIISSSKSASNSMMEAAGIPLPKRWQECGYPIVVKPSSQSGSAGVMVANDEQDVAAGIEMIMRMGDEPVIQEFVSGTVVSTEVIGNGHDYRSFVTTEIMLSKDYDCKRVRCAPGILSQEREDEFRRIAETIGERMNLGALMDVEAINSKDGLKVLEIDARIPSQTPAAVLAATGINLLEELVNSRSGVPPVKKKDHASSYEHLLVRYGKVTTTGEREFAAVRDPRTVRGLFGSDEMITDYEDGSNVWRCAMINSAADEETLEKKRARCIEAIMEECGSSDFEDPSPEII